MRVAQVLHAHRGPPVRQGGVAIGQAHAFACALPASSKRSPVAIASAKTHAGLSTGTLKRPEQQLAQHARVHSVIPARWAGGHRTEPHGAHDRNVILVVEVEDLS